LVLDFGAEPMGEAIGPWQREEKEAYEARSVR